ncbi:MAG: peptidase [Alphaproteobacteria bacterium CG11_big_fil_rev_8_21_14_0_20_39_49]|nr:MAG: peptidase [Alphaproteobacteria bacterium CG11_big_fil_rev_8_21_14_0_20_39_49]
MKIFSKIILIITLLCQSAYAVTIIRDAEIENVLRDISEPIFEAAGLSHDSINIYIINDPQINAYVSGGSNIYINTGLLGISENPNILTGVLAHETGHIAGGHLLRTTEEYKATSLKATLGYMLGLAAAAAGSPQAGVAIAQGAGHVAQRQLLKHSRTHEEAADQAALSYLDKIGKSSGGLLELLEVLYSKENQIYDELNPYTLTHPLSRERISHVENHLKNSKYKGYTGTQEEKRKFQRAIVKLNAFLEPYEKTLAKYPKTDNSINARYGRAIAQYKVPNITESIKEIDALIEMAPENPFFNELKGQILFENGSVNESVPYYQKAADLLPNSVLLKIILATAQISTEDEKYLNKAILNLRQAVLEEQRNSFAWHQLAIAYGRSGDFGMSNLALAEEAYLSDDKSEVRKFVNLAKKHLKEGSPSHFRANDLLSYIEKD